MNNIYDKITEAPKDPILGLTEEFKSDKNPEKVNLSVGVYPVSYTHLRAHETDS